MEAIKDDTIAGQPYPVKAIYFEDKKVESSKSLKSHLLFFLGLGLCFTGIGILIGVPLMIITSIDRKGCWEIVCPHCQNVWYWNLKKDQAEATGTDCPVCKKRVIFKEGVVSKVE